MVLGFQVKTAAGEYEKCQTWNNTGNSRKPKVSEWGDTRSDIADSIFAACKTKLRFSGAWNGTVTNTETGAGTL
jgi:hypothetical protein